VPHQLGLGDLYPIPCRQCGENLVPVEAKWGTHPVRCPKCNGSMLVRFVKSEGGIRVYSESRFSTARLLTPE